MKELALTALQALPTAKWLVITNAGNAYVCEEEPEIILADGYSRVIGKGKIILIGTVADRLVSNDIVKIKISNILDEYDSIDLQFANESEAMAFIRIGYMSSLFDMYSWVGVDSDGEVCLYESEPVEENGRTDNQVIWEPRDDKEWRRVGWVPESDSISGKKYLLSTYFTHSSEDEEFNIDTVLEKIKSELPEIIRPYDNEDYTWVAVDRTGVVNLYYSKPDAINDGIWQMDCGEGLILLERISIETDTLIAEQALFKFEDLLNGTESKKSDAVTTLEDAIATIAQRGEGYDSGEERSMPKVVELFNSLTGHNLTANEGWKFMILLKLVRSQQGTDKLDNYIDGAGYFALASEEVNDE